MQGVGKGSLSDRADVAAIARMSAAGAPRMRSRQKPRFLAADNEVMSAEIAGMSAARRPLHAAAGKNHAF